MSINEPTYKNLNEEGYLLLPGFLSREECRLLKEDLTRCTLDLVFTRQGFKVDYDDPKVLKLLTDMKFRKTKLGEKGGSVVWRNGNSREPLVSKNCGMTHIHFNETLLDNITFNTRLYDEASKIMGTKYLVHSYGPERFSIKAPGSVDMPQHIDANLFDDEVNYDFRIQCLATIDIDEEISERDSGTLCVLTYFHHYWNFARELFHPFRGLFPMKVEMMKSRFFTLPNDKKDRDDFNRDYLPNLKKYGNLYTIYLSTEEIPSDLQKLCKNFFEMIKKKGITVPLNVKYLEKMDWTPIKMEQGDVVWWHQYLPHQSLRNRSKKTSRIAAYYSVFPVKKGWYGSEHQKWVSKQFEKCEFYYGVDFGKFVTTPVNIEELEMIRESKKMKYISQKSKVSRFFRQISGQESWWEEENLMYIAKNPESSTCIDVKNLCDSIIDNLKTSEGPQEVDIKEKLPLPDKDNLCSSDDVTIDEKDTQPLLVFQDEYWEYIPSFIPEEYFGKLLPQLEETCESYDVKTFRGIYPSRRISVLYAEDKEEVHRRADAKSNNFDYSDTPTYEWKIAPQELLEIRDIIEKYFNLKIDYVLCHIYRGIPEGSNPGSDYIGLHCDREALNSSVISVSLGATRRFLFREKNDEKNAYDQITLNSGDVLHMYGPKKLKNGKTQGSCQTVFKHEVPKMNIDDLVNHIQSCGVEIPKGKKTYKSLGEVIRKNNISPDRINLTFRQFED